MDAGTTISYLNFPLYSQTHTQTHALIYTSAIRSEYIYLNFLNFELPPETFLIAFPKHIRQPHFQFKFDFSNFSYPLAHVDVSSLAHSRFTLRPTASLDQQQQQHLSSAYLPTIYPKNKSFQL